MKLCCACERDGWGRLSDDGSGHYNPDPSEGLWGGGSPTLQAVHDRILRPDSVRDHRSDHEMREGRRQTSRQSAHAGSRLKLKDDLGRSRLKGQPSSRTGENPPYGMIGGIEETSASFEARSAPRSHPTAGGGWQQPSLPRTISGFGPWPTQPIRSRASPLIGERSASVPFGSYETDRARSARAALQRIARAPSVPSANTLPTNTGPAVSAAVIPMKS